MTRPLGWALVALMLAMAPAVTAQDCEAPDCQQSHSDVPGAGEPGKPTNGNASDEPDEPTFGDCGGEVCAFGNETCIECSGPVPETCMDGSARDCDDVQYLDGRGPADCENCRGDGAGDDSAVQDVDGKDASAAGALVGITLLGAALLRRNAQR